MKTIIAGCRDFDHYPTFLRAVAGCPWAITEVVSGCARGVDSMGETWAKQNGITIRQFPAEWGRYGKAAGRLRNVSMADYAEALIAVWDSKSPGTGHMVCEAKKRGLQIHIFRIDRHPVLE